MLQFTGALTDCLNQRVIVPLSIANERQHGDTFVPAKQGSLGKHPLVYPEGIVKIIYASKPVAKIARKFFQVGAMIVTNCTAYCRYAEPVLSSAKTDIKARIVRDPACTGEQFDERVPIVLAISRSERQGSDLAGTYSDSFAYANAERGKMTT